jgi:hypothetical protein
MQIQYDSRFLRLNDVTAGDFLGQGKTPVFTKNIQNDGGLATIQIATPQGAAGVSGMGVLVNLNFQGVKSGSTNVRIPNLRVTNSQGQVLTTSAEPLAVTIQ